MTALFNQPSDTDSLRFRHHHVGFLVKDIPLASQDFISRLGYAADSGVIHDPIQTAYVQFLRQPGATSWLELITPDGPKSKLSNALSKGGGLHHLCHEVNDMDRAREHLRAQAMFMIAPPAPAAAFPGRRIAWFLDQDGFLLELLEEGDGPLSLKSIMK